MAMMVGFGRESVLNSSFYILATACNHRFQHLVATIAQLVGYPPITFGDKLQYLGDYRENTDLYLTIAGILISGTNDLELALTIQSKNTGTPLPVILRKSRTDGIVKLNSLYNSESTATRKPCGPTVLVEQINADLS